MQNAILTLFLAFIFLPRESITFWMIKEQCPAHVVHKDPASRSLLVGHGQTPELRNFHSLFFSNGEPARFQQALSYLIKNSMLTYKSINQN